MSNRQEITKILEAYISKGFTSRAIMLDGGWGCGKTFVAKKFMEGNKHDRKIIYISLFGLKTIEDIEIEIFRSISLLGDNSNEIKSILNGQSIAVDDMKIGGIGSVVQLLIKNRKNKMIEKAKSQVIFFDDLERWSGDINICLSYANKIVEQFGAKCIIIGSSENLSDINQEVLSTSLEKTISAIYKINSSGDIDDSTINISLENIGSGKLNNVVIDVISNNIEKFQDTLLSSKCDNIRLVSESIQLFNEIYENNHEKMSVAPHLLTEYFNILLATKILVTKFYNTKKKKDDFFSVDFNHSYDSLKKLGYFNKKEIGDIEISSEEKELLSIIFHYTEGKIFLKGIFSIIKNSYYIDSDFIDGFSNWKSIKNYEKYLDVARFYKSNNEEAKGVIVGTIVELYSFKEIKNPITIIALADRFTNDIKRGVVNYDIERANNHLCSLVDYLYKSKTMDVIKITDGNVFSYACRYCKPTLNHIKRENERYLKENEGEIYNDFWDELKHTPDTAIKKMSDLINEPLFIASKKSKDFFLIIDELSNEQLFLFCLEMQGRYTIGLNNALNKERECAVLFARYLDKVSQDKYTVRHSHFKQISRVILNGKTEYDLSFTPNDE